MTVGSVLRLASVARNGGTAMNKHSENDQDVEYSTTVKTGNGSDQSNDDVVSDPALDDRVGND